jgi:hypothetical protein
VAPASQQPLTVRPESPDGCPLFLYIVCWLEQQVVQQEVTLR